MKKFIKAFTLVELIVAISVIAIILAIAIPQYRLYSANLQLRKETQKFASFLKDARLTAKSQCVDIDLYDCGVYGISYDTPRREACVNVNNGQEPLFPHSWLQVNWISPAYAQHNLMSLNAQYSTQMKAKNERINYLKLYTPQDGLYLSAHYLIKHIMTVTPNGFRTEGGAMLNALHFRIVTETTPKYYDTTINDAGTCGITSDGSSNPGASGSE